MEAQIVNPSAGVPIPSIRVPLPEGALDIPYPHERVLHFEAGLYLDNLLRPLARVSGAIDRALALRLWRLRERSGYKHVGCARFSDYAREHLGLAVRTAQQMVRLGKGLERLPLLDAALAEGRVTWTGALQVVRVAGKEDEAQWVSLAEQLSVRELRQKVGEALASASDAKCAKPGKTDEASALAREAASAELVSNDEGAGRDVEADDAKSGKPINDSGAEREADDDDPLQRLSVTCAWSVARLWHAAIELCEMVVGGPMAEGEAPEYVLAELLSGLPAIPDGAVAPHRPPAPVLDRMGTEPGSRRGPRLVAQLAEELGSRVLSAKQHRRIAKFLDLVSDDVPEDPFGLDESMKALIRARTELELDLARLLRNFRAYGLARHIGFPSFKDYVSERLGISVDRARFLVRLDNRLIHFPRVRRAVRRGEIGTVAALLVCRVAESELTERAWIERARKRTVERLREEVQWAEREAGRSYVGSVMPPPLGRLPSDLDAVTAELLVSRDESAEAEADATDSTTGLPKDPARDETFAHPVHEGREMRVEFRLRESAVELWQEVKQRLCWAGGRWVVSSEQVLYEAALAFLVTYMPLWLHAVEHGDPIAVRDRFQCIVPGCTNRCGSPHHLRFRSQGGSDDEWNLGHMCHTHHLELLHQRGFIRVHGRAPDNLVFELGIRPDGTAVEVFVNEERVDGPVSWIPGVTPLERGTHRDVELASSQEDWNQFREVPSIG